MSTCEQLIAYDARVIRAHPPEWLASSRQQYLLRPEVTVPLSTDRTVWPSPLKRGDGSPEEFQGMIFWDDVSNLVRHARKLQSDYQLIAVTIVRGLWPDDDAYERERWDQYAGRLTPPALSEGSTLLGYDVSDDYLLSGLSNCGYEGDAAALRKQWAALLNENHLFWEIEAAKAFAEMTDHRVEEHAPFWVFGLYAISVEKREG